jgi:hypothetical protein
MGLTIYVNNGIPSKRIHRRGDKLVPLMEPAAAGDAPDRSMIATEYHQFQTLLKFQYSIRNLYVE